MNRLYYLGQPGDGYGWGVCNTNLISALKKHCDVIYCENTKRRNYESPVFVPIADHDLNPSRKCHSPFTLGYTFFELPLGRNAKFNARKYRHIFAGSKWCEERLRDAGINHCSTLVQGVDLEKFTAKPWPEQRNGFRVFSGGKMEYRKGQDIVLAALRSFQNLHKDVVLVTQWANPWPQTALTMRRSTLVEFGQQGEKLMSGMQMDRIVQPPRLPNDRMCDLYAQCDVGLFPNRCEGGTNLVLMEFMASGRPVIATYATGHKDVMDGEGPIRLSQGSYDWAKWFHTDPSNCIYWLEHLYRNRDELKRRGDQCRALIEQWTWDRAAKTISNVLANRPK